MQDQLSARAVAFRVSPGTKFSSFKGNASSADVQPGALVDVQFSADRSNRDVAKEIIVLAKPGDDYIFSGVVTNLDLRQIRWRWKTAAIKRPMNCISIRL